MTANEAARIRDEHTGQASIEPFLKNLYDRIAAEARRGGSSIPFGFDLRYLIPTQAQKEAIRVALKNQGYSFRIDSDPREGGEEVCW